MNVYIFFLITIKVILFFFFFPSGISSGNKEKYQKTLREKGWGPPQELEAYPCIRVYLLISSIMKSLYHNELHQLFADFKEVPDDTVVMVLVKETTSGLIENMCFFKGCSYFSGFIYSWCWPFLLCLFLHVLKLSLTHWLYLRI